MYEKISKMHSSITCFSAVAEANILHTLGGLLLLLTEPGSRLKAMIKIEERQKKLTVILKVASLKSHRAGP